MEPPVSAAPAPVLPASVKKTASIGVQVNLTKSKSSPNLVRKAQQQNQQMVELIDLESVGNKRLPRSTRETASAPR